MSVRLIKVKLLDKELFLMENQALSVEDMLLHSFSADESLRRLAEETAASLENVPEAYATLLGISTNVEANLSIRQAAAVTLKNFIKRKWHPMPVEGQSSEAALILTDEVKSELKELILNGMICEENSLIRKLLIAIVGSLTKYDYPTKWPNLLPSLLELLSTTDSALAMHNCLLVIRTIAKQDGERVLDSVPHFFEFVDAILPLLNTLINNLIEAGNFTDEVSSICL